MGNHDHHIENNRGGTQGLFKSVSHYNTLEFGMYKFQLMHYPISSWDGMNTGIMHLHGHVHLPPHLRISEGKAMDVGCDGNGLYPIDYKEVYSLLKDRPVAKLCLPKDHHEKRI